MELTATPAAWPDEREFGDVLRGWQHGGPSATNVCIFFSLIPHLERCWRSQAGLHAVQTVAVFLTSAKCLRRFSGLCYVVLLCRLRLPLPVVRRGCTRRGRLDLFGDHRAACAAWHLGVCPSGGPLRGSGIYVP